MLSFMDYVLDAFGEATNCNRDNSYSALTATSDALLSFPIPSNLSLNVSSLSTAHFATSYSLSTLGVIAGSLSYLYSSVPLSGIPSATPSIPLRSLVRGYRDIRLPLDPAQEHVLAAGERKPTLLYGTLALPPPSTLSALYSRRVAPRTIVTISSNSKSTTVPTIGSSPPPASVLAHLQHDAGRFSVEALGSTDSALIGVKGLWNFGLLRDSNAEGVVTNNARTGPAEGFGDNSVSPENVTPGNDVRSKPSLLSAGAEVYYSPLSSVVGLSTGLRFTTLPSALSRSSSLTRTRPLAGTSAAFSSAPATTTSSSAASSFPYTMTLTLTPLTGSLASTYSIRPSPKLSLSSRFGFNVYSWESEYVLGAEIWRQGCKPHRTPSNQDGLDWAREKAVKWMDSEQKLLAERQVEATEEKQASVIKLRIDGNWNLRALWTGRIKELLVSAGINLAPTSSSFHRSQASAGVGGFEAVSENRLKGSVGVEVAYSS